MSDSVAQLMWPRSGHLCHSAAWLLWLFWLWLPPGGGPVCALLASSWTSPKTGVPNGRVERDKLSDQVFRNGYRRASCEITDLAGRQTTKFRKLKSTRKKAAGLGVEQWNHAGIRMEGKLIRLRTKRQCNVRTDGGHCFCRPRVEEAHVVHRFTKTPKLPANIYVHISIVFVFSPHLIR